MLVAKQLTHKGVIMHSSHNSIEFMILASQVGLFLRIF